MATCICKHCGKSYTVNNYKRNSSNYCSLGCKYIGSCLPVDKRFWERVDRNGPIQPHMNTPCWQWTGTMESKGYGTMRVRGRPMKAHRLSLQIHGINPGNMFVCHHCDNPACVNPDHLYLGSGMDNVKDMISRGRKRVTHGTDSSVAKLTDDTVREIRELYATGKYSQSAIAEKYNVCQSLVSGIVRGRRWKHI